jgi:23S rRNA (uracil1939-C5)-methyltransferase/tRNA (uracil-5-)-methyltransferase
LPWPFEYHEELKVTIHDLTNLGVGVGRVDISDRMNSELAPESSNSSTSWVVMVPKTLPGEQVVCKVFRNFKGYSDADLVSLTTASPDRVEPVCAYFDKCGGCQYQMMSITAQREWKTKQVVDLLQRLAGVEGALAQTMVSPCIGTDEAYGYRSKITPHYNAPKKSVAELKIGFQQRGTRIIEDIPSCVIAMPALNAKYAERREEIRRNMEDKGLPKKGATLLFRQGLKLKEDKEEEKEEERGKNNTKNELLLHVETDYREIMEEVVMGVTFRYRAGEFFQNNPFALPVLVKHVLELVKGDDCDYLIDAYCGSGLFSLVGAGHFKNTYGVEISEIATKAAQANAELNGITNARFYCGGAEAIFEQVTHLDRDKTCILLDPPRKGCDDLFLGQLFAFRPKKVVYISCDAATQARDTRAILAAGYVFCSFYFSSLLFFPFLSFPFLDCDVSVSLSLLSIYCPLLALSDTTCRLTNTHTQSIDTILTSIVTLKVQHQECAALRFVSTDAPHRKRNLLFPRGMMCVCGERKRETERERERQRERERERERSYLLYPFVIACTVI